MQTRLFTLAVLCAALAGCGATEATETPIAMARTDCASLYAEDDERYLPCVERLMVVYYEERMARRAALVNATSAALREFGQPAYRSTTECRAGLGHIAPSYTCTTY